MMCKFCKTNPLSPQCQEATQAGLCVACWDRPFPITSVCRADLIAYLTPAQIGHFADDDMLELAGKMADAYLDQAFWIHLEILSKDVLDHAEQ